MAFKYSISSGGHDLNASIDSDSKETKGSISISGNTDVYKALMRHLINKGAYPEVFPDDFEAIVSSHGSFSIEAKSSYGSYSYKSAKDDKEDDND